ncbi:ATP-binding cassette domain-containing protein [Oenococcus oeni]
MALIKISDLNFTYPKEKERALKNINLDITEGEFFLLCGVSGSGKSTLLRQIKQEIKPFGKESGQIFYNGKPLGNLDGRVSAHEIGFVTQNPENQVVTDKVWHELAFGLESLGLSTKTIRRRVAEMASFFGIQEWFDKNVAELSGGQMQILNLASVMIMQPHVLILDEPTSQLDPIAADDFLEMIERINRELSVAIILTEHHLEKVFPIADRVAVMEKGSVICCDTPSRVAKEMSQEGKAHPIFAGFPASVRIYSGIRGNDNCPLTVREGNQWLRKHFSYDNGDLIADQGEKWSVHDPAVELRNIWFRYGKKLPDVLKGVTLKIYSGQITCLLGGNGTGKTTTLDIISGLYKAYRGKTKLMGKKIMDYKSGELYKGVVGMLPQNPQLLFVRDTVREDLKEMAKECNAEGQLKKIVHEMELEELLDRHPYDLSGGEQQKAAFAKMLLRSPKIILLDEPTKGLDANFKISFAEILKKLSQKGMAILMATHDVEFAAECADYCLLFFNGAVVSEDTPVPFFSGNNFYTTAANRIARQTFPNAITCEGVIKKCILNLNQYVSK